MIELSFSAAFMLYLFLTLSLILALWLYSNYQFKSKEVVSPESQLLVCEYCHFAYLADSSQPVTSCPQCRSFNKENRFKKK